MYNTIKVRFKTENCSLPRDMSKVMLSFIKASLKSVSEEKYNEWYESGNVMKSFCWSPYFPDANIHDDIIDIGENWFAVNFSTPVREDFNILASAIAMRKGDTVSINRNSIKVDSVKIIPHNSHKEQCVLVKTESPVIIRGKEKAFLSQKDPEFTDALNISVKSLLSHFDMNDEIKIEPVMTKTVAVLAFGPATANSGFFKIVGDTEAINFVLASGIGAKRSEGFGRLKYIGGANVND